MADEEQEAPLPSQQLPQPSASQIDEVEPESCIKILLATDNHIGYNEKDPVRGQDSINSFKEILELAVKNDVDMLLLAGDLFHENKPSRSSIYQTMSLLRDYTMSSRPINLEIVSDAGIGLGHSFNWPQINYEDENYNVGLPVFSIHGNHDDPQGAGPEGALCALDVLSASGLINYFGRQELPGNATNDEEAQEQGIHVKPILLQKGRTKLALYGIGNIRDERFNAELRKSHVSLFQPETDSEDWFNLLLIHQNRAARGVKNSVPENGFGDEVDLVIWGHEHDCRITPEPVAGREYSISQPGSSVATSLAAGESIPKHVAILKIQDRTYQMDPIRLRTVRPFVFDDVFLEEERDNKVDLSTKQKVTKFLKAKVEELITEANTQWNDIERAEDETPMLPLIRLRVDYSSAGEPFEVGNPQRFGQEFTGRVANPRDIVQFYRKKRIEHKNKIVIDKPDAMDVDEDGDVNTERGEKIKMEVLVKQYLEAQQLTVIAENAIAAAVDQFIEKQEKDAIKTFIHETRQAREKEVAGNEISEALNSDDDVEDQINKAKQRAYEIYEKDPDAFTTKKKKSKKTKKDESEEEEDSEPPKAKKGKGKAKAVSSGEESDFGNLSGASGSSKKSTAAKTGNKKGKEKDLFLEDSDESDAKCSKKKTIKAPAKKAPPKKAAAKKAPELSFAPTRSSGRASGRAAAGKANKNMTIDISDSEDD